MFLGISIHPNEIIVAVQNKAGKINIVHPEGTCQGVSKLKVHVDGKYAYLGTAVELLLAYDSNLSNTDDVGILPKQIQYKEANGTVWNTAELLALFFKQIKTSLLQDAISFSNVVVTVAQPLTALHETIIRDAAAYAEFKSCSVVDMTTVIKEAHQPSVTATKRVLHLRLNETDCHFTLGELHDDRSYIEIEQSTDSKKGINSLITNLQELVQNEYKKITAPEVKITSAHIEKQRTLAKQLLQAHVTADHPYLKMCCMFQMPLLELKIPRTKVTALIDDYVEDIAGIIKELGNMDIIFYSGADEIAKPLTRYFNQHASNAAVYTEYAHTILARGAARMASQLEEHAVPEVREEIAQQIIEMNINKELISVLS